MRYLVAALSLAAAVYGFGSNCGGDGSKLVAKKIENYEPMPTNFKIAFVGDSGSGSQQAQVFKMVKDFGADLLLQGGDFDYEDDPALWDELISESLGDDFPMLTVIGNHDDLRWTGTNGYQQRMIRHMDRANLTQYCSGDYGVNFHCVFKGMLIVLSGIGERGTGHEAYAEQALRNNPVKWRHCNWHKNMRLYQTGSKVDETSYEIMDICREYGAFIANHHEHSYSRTYTMSDFGRFSIASRTNDVSVLPGQSFMFVTALGGNSVRSWEDNLNENPWWAALAAADNGASDGPLLCTFNYNGDINKAYCEMVDRRGKVFDRFYINNYNVEGEVPKIEKRCPEKKIDIQVASSENDAFEFENGKVVCAAKVLPLAKRSDGKFAVRFENVKISKQDNVRTSHLQFFGVRSNSAHPNITIRAEMGDSKPIQCVNKHDISNRQVTKASVSWTRHGEDFESNTIWVSPDLSPLIREVVSSENWTEESALTFIIEGYGDLETRSFDASPCGAPSFFALFERKC